MKTKEQVLNWVDYMLKSNPCMNVEDRNMFNAIKYYIAEKQTDGDLISRDYVLSKFKEQCDRCGKYKENNGVMCRCCALDDAIDYVEDAPSAEKTAEWIIKHKVTNSGSFWEIKCSNCEIESDSIYRYCPQCGARMKKSGEEK